MEGIKDWVCPEVGCGRSNGEKHRICNLRAGGRLDGRCVEPQLGRVGGLVRRAVVSLEVHHGPAGVVSEGQVHDSFEEGAVGEAMNEGLFAAAFGAAGSSLQ